MIILIGNQKGGVGKTTIACNFAGMLVNRGKDVILVEADEQRTASSWVLDRKEENPDLPKINSVQKLGDVDDALIDLDSRYEFVVVDAAGRDSRELATALTVCHIVVIPFRASKPDLGRLPHMANITKSAKRFNPNMRVVAFLNSAPTNTQGVDAELARVAIAQYPDIELLKTIVHDRRVYRDAIAEGLTVEEMTDKSSSTLAAKSEMISLLGEVLGEAI